MLFVCMVVVHPVCECSVFFGNAEVIEDVVEL